jgi:hypothetical protein
MESKVSIDKSHSMDESIDILNLLYKDDEETLKHCDKTEATTTSPFSILKSTDKKVSFNENTHMTESMNQLSVALNKFTQFENKREPKQAPKPPYKPWIAPRGRGRPSFNRNSNSQYQPRRFDSNNRGRGFDRSRSFSSFRKPWFNRNQNNSFSPRGRNFTRPFNRNRQFNRDYSRDRNFRNRTPYQRFDRSPSRTGNIRQKPPNKDDQRCFNCREIGHWSKECPQLRNNRSRNNSQSDLRQMTEVDMEVAIKDIQEQLMFRNTESLNN